MSLKKFLRVALAIVFGLFLCYCLSWLGVILGVLGLIGGAVLGAMLPSIIGFLLRDATWYERLIVGLLVIAAFVAAVF